jgi:hypothetical protein
MRLWTVHPKYLDRRGLVGLWREALLAQKVLRGETTAYAYRSHPQLVRFRGQSSPRAAYLNIGHEEAVTPGYRFTSRKIGRRYVAAGQRPE